MEKFRNYIISSPLSYNLDIIYTSLDNISTINNSRHKTRAQCLKKIKRSLAKNVVVEIPSGKWRPVKAIKSTKLSNELGIVAKNFLTHPNKKKELTIEAKDYVSRASIVTYTYFSS